ncbi:GNAT family N-acetyltransferase [Nocardia brasiliensis]|uniref:GNAT family N-acetyltransferase n=1 Tax=Nocardia brasiliensis TaxID=37326 RepID=UPI0033F4FB12
MSEPRESDALQATTVSFRPGARADDSAVDRIDGSFTTDTIVDVRNSAEGFVLREVPVSPPIVKHFPDDADSEEDAPVRFVAVDQQGHICGAIDVVYAEWNRRLTIVDIKVAPTHRGQGLGRRLVDLAIAHGRESGARTLWLEVTNINAPAIRAYRRMGFAFCGLDTSLYRGTPAESEIAIFMSRDITNDGAQPDRREQRSDDRTVQ